MTGGGKACVCRHSSRDVVEFATPRPAALLVIARRKTALFPLVRFHVTLPWAVHATAARVILVHRGAPTRFGHFPSTPTRDDLKPVEVRTKGLEVQPGTIDGHRFRLKIRNWGGGLGKRTSRGPFFFAALVMIKNFNFNLVSSICSYYNIMFTVQGTNASQ